MTGWNHDIASAPRDRKLWLASECGKVIGLTAWDGKRNQWAGFATTGKPPLAWQPYIVPVHPNTDPEAKASVEQRSDHPTMRAAGREMRVGEAGRGYQPATSDDGRDSLERQAPHFILDDVGSGA
ncbi:hypothetical protein ACFFP0_24730 [Rhizobium puerariae]|uniref:Uncharacterized protein n=1 Tax=Rhizobium puerariae TaxID=1585791 RepID=A0ABV6AN65_9HYPH